MDEKELSELLYHSFYWHYRREYGKIADMIEADNSTVVSSTKSAEDYALRKIVNLIRLLRESE